MQIHDAVVTLEERIGRTNLLAGRAVALIAEDGEEESAGVGERAFLDGLDPTAVHAHRNLVLGLARDRAGVAADAFSKVDGEPVVGHAGFRIYHARLDAGFDHHRGSETLRSDTASRDRPAEPVGCGAEGSPGKHKRRGVSCLRFPGDPSAPCQRGSHQASGPCRTPESAPGGVLKAAVVKFDAQRGVVHRFEQARSENAMHLDRGPDDPVGDHVECF